MFEIIFNELKMQPDGPKFVVGDVNATTADIMSLNLALLTPDGETHAWHDIGALAELWGQTPCEPTCKAYNANQPTRRDYVIANTEGLELVESFEVNWKDLFAVHATIQFTINLEALEEKKRVVSRAESFHAKLMEMVRNEFHYQPEDVFQKEAWDRLHELLGNTHTHLHDGAV